MISLQVIELKDFSQKLKEKSCCNQFETTVFYKKFYDVSKNIIWNAAIMEYILWENILCVKPFLYAYFSELSFKTFPICIIISPTSADTNVADTTEWKNKTFHYHYYEERMSN